MPVGNVFNSVGGSGGVGLNNLIQYDCSSQLDGVTTTFNVFITYATGSLQVYWNGLLQLQSDIVETSGTSFTTSFTPQSDDHLVVIYLTN